jgi:hypothetical protein
MVGIKYIKRALDFSFKFSTEMLIRTMNRTLTHNDTQIYLGFLFNIYIKIISEYERFKTHKTIQRGTRKLEYI